MQCSIYGQKKDCETFESSLTRLRFSPLRHHFYNHPQRNMKRNRKDESYHVDKPLQDIN